MPTVALHSWPGAPNAKKQKDLAVNMETSYDPLLMTRLVLGTAINDEAVSQDGSSLWSEDPCSKVSVPSYPDIHALDSEENDLLAAFATMSLDSESNPNLTSRLTGAIQK